MKRNLHFWDKNHVQEALRAIMKRRNLKRITTKDFPVYKDGKFNIFQKLLGLHKNNDTIYTLDKYAAHWCYTTITYRIVGDTAYVDTINYNVFSVQG